MEIVMDSAHLTQDIEYKPVVGIEVAAYWEGWQGLL